ncbi:P-loop containing nucleoside triphosphate hydrolase protein, partial [Nadsonia fulvescens var. elongata DSM 6958]
PSRQLFPSLNDEQWQAVSFNVQSRTQILAGPGTGKTRTLTSRVSYLLRLGVRPENIIVTTFTKKAATEMRERITQLGHNDETINRLKIGTFHYICFRFLKIFGKMIGLSPKVTIADTKDRDDLMKRLLQDPKMEQLLDEVMAKDYKRHFIKYKVTKGVRVYDVDHTTNKISELMSKGVTSVQYAAMADNNRCLSIVYTGYIDLLTASEKLDFDTMLLYTVDLLKQQPQLVDNIEHLLVDEYQDTNPVQLELIYLLAQKSSNITVVGDPDQSIYGFRSADPENFDKMRLYYRDTKILFLQKNYRSTHGILELSTALIQQDTKRVSSERRLIGQVGIDKLRPVYMVKEDDEYFESRFIALNSKGLVEKVGGLFTYNDISILVRSSARMRLIENELNKKAIPYVVVGGLRFWERHEIRVLVDYLRVIYSDFDNLALARILNVPKRGIGDASVKQLKDYEQFGKENMFQLLEYLSDPVHESRKFCLADGQCFNLRPSLRQSILSFVSIINSCRSILEEEDTNGQGQILKMLEFLLSRLQFEKYIKENFPDNYESRIENIKEISKQFEDLLKGGNIKDGFDDFNGLEEESDLRPDSTVTNSSIVLLEQFFTTVNLNAAVDNSPDTSTPAITISTIHASKGLEWPVVYVASCINGVIPHKLSEDMSEERRILFVAMTRARILLYVT